MKKMRNRKSKKNSKFIVNVMFIFSILLIISLFTNYNLANKQLKTNEIIVQSDDTIWNLAKKACKNKENINIQNVVIEIKEINNLNSSDIYVGQVLNIPVY